MKYFIKETCQIDRPGFHDLKAQSSQNRIKKGRVFRDEMKNNFKLDFESKFC